MQHQLINAFHIQKSKEDANMKVHNALTKGKNWSNMKIWNVERKVKTPFTKELFHKFESLIWFVRCENYLSSSISWMPTTVTFHMLSLTWGNNLAKLFSVVRGTFYISLFVCCVGWVNWLQLHWYCSSDPDWLLQHWCNVVFDIKH